MQSFAELLRAAQKIPAEAYVVDRTVDDKGKYHLELEPEFPFAIKRLRFLDHQTARPLTWHTYLEIFLLLSESCRIQMGGTIVELRHGDALIMDHLKLHGVLDFAGKYADAIVIRFLPNIALGVASSASDHLLLLPFYCHAENGIHIVRREDLGAAPIHRALASLLGWYSLADSDPYRQIGTRAYFLEALTHLARHFRSAEELSSRFSLQQGTTNRLRKLFDHIGKSYMTGVSLTEAARITGLSKPRFSTIFKRATGMTLIAYITQVRLSEAVNLLKTTDKSIAEIADSVGFADQSYFDRRFRRHFERTPRAFRLGLSK